MVRRTSCDTAGMRAQQFPEPDTTVLKLAEQLADPAVCEAALVAIDRFLPLTQSSHGAIAQACQGVLRQPPVLLYNPPPPTGLNFPWRLSS
jgi:hypothetical protein